MVGLTQRDVDPEIFLRAFPHVVQHGRTVGVTYSPWFRVAYSYCVSEHNTNITYLLVASLLNLTFYAYVHTNQLVTPNFT